MPRTGLVLTTAAATLTATLVACSEPPPERASVAGSSAGPSTTGAPSSATPSGSPNGSTGSQSESSGAATVPWDDVTEVPHLFYHSLVVDPKRAFTSSRQGIGFNKYMVTVDEFTQQLEQLHANGWVLVHPQDLATPDEDGVMRPKELRLPEGKKPLVLSVDDVSYYEYMKGKGFPSKLIARPDGSVVNTYTDADGTTREGSYDVMPIVDDFVKKHPDFSHRGHKGTLAITGYNGILGYRTSEREYGDTDGTRKEQEHAKAVAEALKKNGWNFASHTWGHINMTDSPLTRIKADAQRWDREVRPLVGDTPLLIYPFGADISGPEPYASDNEKYAYLRRHEGFDYFFNVDASRTHWMQLGKRGMRQARINVDGLSMQRAIQGRTTVLDGFFDTESTIDPDRPMPIPKGGGPAPGGD